MEKKYSTIISLGTLVAWLLISGACLYALYSQVAWHYDKPFIEYPWFVLFSLVVRTFFLYVKRTRKKKDD